MISPQLKLFSPNSWSVALGAYPISPDRVEHQRNGDVDLSHML
jgi:hypothetical protein